MDQDQLNNNSNATAADTKQELKQRVDNAIDKITKSMRWTLALGLALIFFALFFSLSYDVEQHIVGYKLIHAAVFGLVMVILSAIDYHKISRLKKATSRQELMAGVAHLKRSESLTKWLLIVFVFTYILLDVLSEGSIGMMVFGGVIFLIFVLVYLTTFEGLSTHKRVKELEDDLRQLSEMED